MCTKLIYYGTRIIYQMLLTSRLPSLEIRCHQVKLCHLSFLTSSLTAHIVPTPPMFQSPAIMPYDHLDNIHSCPFNTAPISLANLIILPGTINAWNSLPSSIQSSSTIGPLKVLSIEPAYIIDLYIIAICDRICEKGPF